MEQDEFDESTADQSESGAEPQLDPNNPDHVFSLLEREFTQVFQTFMFVLFQQISLRFRLPHKSNRIHTRHSMPNRLQNFSKRCTRISKKVKN